MQAAAAAGSVCAFFHLLRLCASTGLAAEDVSDIVQLKRSAQRLVNDLIDPMLPQLLRSFDASLTDEATGNNALHELLSLAAPTAAGSWLPRMICELVRHGVDLNECNKRGETAALSYVAKMRPDAPSTIVHLLLQLGSDINAQDATGSTLLHHLVSKRAFRVLHDLYADPDGTATAPVEYFRTDSKGRTVAQLAAYQCAKRKHEDECEDFYRFIESQVQMVQEKRIEALCEPLIPDLALIALQYLDGSGRPFAAPQVEEEEVLERAAAAPLARIQARDVAVGSPPLGVAGAPAAAAAATAAVVNPAAA